MTEETMKKELNVTEVLDRVKALDNYDKRELFAGRGYKLYYVTDGDFGCLPEAVMHQCIRIFLRRWFFRTSGVDCISSTKNNVCNDASLSGIHDRK